jgi:hypothetical protein
MVEKEREGEKLTGYGFVEVSGEVQPRGERQ